MRPMRWPAPQTRGFRNRPAIRLCLPIRLPRGHWWFHPNCCLIRPNPRLASVILWPLCRAEHLEELSRGEDRHVGDCLRWEVGQIPSDKVLGVRGEGHL